MGCHQADVPEQAVRPRVRTGGDSLGCLYRSTSESWRPVACACVKDDSEIPSRRTPFLVGRSFSSKPTLRTLEVRETVDRVVDGLASGDLLKVGGEVHRGEPI